MRNDLDHLPADKQRELERVVQIIFEEFEDAFALSRHEWKAERIDRLLTYVWPTDCQRDRALFEKLKAAYVKARYSKHYRISEAELSWLGEQVEELGRVVYAICAERIADLKRAAGITA